MDAYKHRNFHLGFLGPGFLLTIRMTTAKTRTTTTTTSTITTISTITQSGRDEVGSGDGGTVPPIDGACLKRDIKFMEKLNGY